MQSKPFAATHLSVVLGLLAWWLCAPAVLSAETAITHQLSVRVLPEQHRIEVQDRLSVPMSSTGGGEISFLLHAAFAPRIEPSGWTLEKMPHGAAPANMSRYRLEVASFPAEFTLSYAAELDPDAHFSAGRIGPEGVYLGGSAAWYPTFDQQLNLFSLEVFLPPQWLAVSQGESVAPVSASAAVRWQATHPQDVIYLVAGPWQRYVRETPFGQAQVYLRTPDAALATSYLQATERYLQLYSNLLGAYPFAKFALVENFWESGFGMPSFTLLGPRVLRLPFIIHTSYPHEIAHNWWGNGIYVDYEHGNWSEGLTAYLADHLLREMRGDGAGYRRDALQKYRNYVTREADFPLSDFIAKHGDASEAVGYNKTLMVFHMLRLKLGDADFVAGLRHFFERHKFRRAGYAELQQSFEVVSGARLNDFFRQWTTRTGAPGLRVDAVSVTEHAIGFDVSGVLRQTQAGEPYRLTVPMMVQSDTGLHPHSLKVAEKSTPFRFSVPQDPLRLLVDPRFDVFRRLHDSEIRASVGALTGAAEAVAILPEEASAALREAYRNLGQQLGVAQFISDAGAPDMRVGGALWIFGWENRWLEEVISLARDYPVTVSGAKVVVAGGSYSRDQDCVVLTFRRPAPGGVLGWVGCDTPDGMPRLARKLPHYGKYSVVGFAKEGMTNQLKTTWPVTASVLNIPLRGARGVPTPKIEPRPALTEQLR